MSYSIKDINALPSIGELRVRCRALALLDAVLMPEWEYRYFSFDTYWDDAGTEHMASMRDGFGSEYFINFSKNGVSGKVLSGSRLADPNSVLNKIPDVFASFKAEPAFNLQSITYCFWCEEDQSLWNATDVDEDYDLLAFLVEPYTYYKSWAEGYYEREIDEGALKRVFESLTINESDLERLNSDIELEDLGEDLQEIFGS